MPYIQCKGCLGTRIMLGPGMMKSEKCKLCNGSGVVKEAALSANCVEFCKPIEANNNNDDVKITYKKKRGRPKSANASN